MSTATPTPLSESALEKAALAIEKLEGRGNWPLWSVNIELALDHTWEYKQKLACVVLQQYNVTINKQNM